MKNRKGQMTIFMIFGFVVIFAIIISFLVFGITFNRINSALDQDIQVGQVNLQEVNAQTFGVFNSAFLNHADTMGILSIFGMILGLFLSSYILRNTLPKWAIVLDIIIIVAVFIFALYLSSAYGSVMDGLASSGEFFLEDNLPKTSKFMLNLPIYVAIIGAIMMVLFHSSIPRKREEELNFNVPG